MQPPSVTGIDITRLVANHQAPLFHGQTAAGAPVAIKVYAADAATSGPRVRREFAAQQSVQSPYVARALDLIELADGRTALISEWVNGEALSTRIQRDGALPEADAVAYLEAIARGLAAIHAVGIFHRDVKPSNVIIPDQNVKTKAAAILVDFGHSLVTDDTRLTQSGMVLGTPAYMAPEQASGHALGPSADLYSAGVVFYQMLTGTLPFTGRAADVVLAHQAQAVPPLQSREANVSASTTDLCMWLLAKDPKRRVPSASVLAATVGMMKRETDGASAARGIR